MCVCATNWVYKIHKGGYGGWGVAHLPMLSHSTHPHFNFNWHFTLAAAKKKRKCGSRAKKFCRKIVGRERGKEGRGVGSIAVSIFAFVALQKKKRKRCYVRLICKQLERRKAAAPKCRVNIEKQST